MEWKTIISFTNNNIPKRYKVVTAKQDTVDKHAQGIYKVKVHELNEVDNSIDQFEFDYDTKEDRFQTKASTKPVLLISEQMVELVSKGEEKW